MNIDWGKAPEGATHKDLKYAPTGFWYKFDFKNDTAAYCPHDENQWVSSGKASKYANDGSMDDMAARPGHAVPQEGGAQVELAKVLISLSGDIRQPINASQAAWMAAQLEELGYRKFEIVEGDV